MSMCPKCFWINSPVCDECGTPLEVCTASPKTNSGIQQIIENPVTVEALKERGFIQGAKGTPTENWWYYSHGLRFCADDNHWELDNVIILGPASVPKLETFLECLKLPDERMGVTKEQYESLNRFFNDGGAK